MGFTNRTLVALHVSAPIWGSVWNTTISYCDGAASCHLLTCASRALNRGRVWLMYFVTELRSCAGTPDLAADDVVTTGTWTDAWPVVAQERWSARFDLLPALEIHFE